MQELLYLINGCFTCTRNEPARRQRRLRDGHQGPMLRLRKLTHTSTVAQQWSDH
jgi:hypothetical protein